MSHKLLRPFIDKVSVLGYFPLYIIHSTLEYSHYMRIGHPFPESESSNVGQKSAIV